MKCLVARLFGVAAAAGFFMLGTGAADRFSGEPAAAQAALIPCAYAPAGYVAQFDSVDGVVDGKVSYPEPRVFIEEQSHLKPPGVTERHLFEHLHVGGCYPYAETWVQPSNARTMDFRLVFHRVQNYNIFRFVGTFADAQNSGGGFAATAAQKAELEMAMDASATSTQTVYQSYTLNNIGTSCRKTFRPSLEVVRANSAALVDEWFAAGQWTSYINYPGQPVCNPEFQQDQVRSRSWILPGSGYLYNTVYQLPPVSQMGPLTDTFDLTLASPSGVQPVTYKAYVDADFHVGNEGVWQRTYSVQGQLPVQVPLDGLSPGVHRLTLVLDAGIQSSIQVIPFEVAARC